MPFYTMPFFRKVRQALLNLSLAKRWRKNNTADRQQATKNSTGNEAAVKPKLDTLSSEIVQKIASCLDGFNLIALRQVSRQLRTVCSTRLLYQNAILRADDFEQPPRLVRMILLKQNLLPLDWKAYSRAVALAYGPKDSRHKREVKIPGAAMAWMPQLLALGYPGIIFESLRSINKYLDDMNETVWDDMEDENDKSLYDYQAASFCHAVMLLENGGRLREGRSWIYCKCFARGFIPDFWDSQMAHLFDPEGVSGYREFNMRKLARAHATTNQICGLLSAVMQLGWSRGGQGPIPVPNYPRPPTPKTLPFEACFVAPLLPRPCSSSATRLFARLHLPHTTSFDFMMEGSWALVAFGTAKHRWTSKPAAVVITNIRFQRRANASQTPGIALSDTLECATPRWVGGPSRVRGCNVLPLSGVVYFQIQVVPPAPLNSTSYEFMGIMTPFDVVGNWREQWSGSFSHWFWMFKEQWQPSL